MRRIPASLCASLIALSLTACGGGGGGQDQAPPPPVNRAPDANAGADVSMNIAASDISLDGSASSDPENGALTFAWTVVSEPAGSTVALSDASAVSPTFASMIPGDYEFELTVTDPAGQTDTDRVVITLLNDVPVVSLAAFDRTPNAGDTATFDASASSDPNGHALTFAWELVAYPAGSSLATDYAGPTHDITFDVAGNYVFELRISDGYDTTTVTLDSVRISEYVAVPLAAAITDAEYDDVGKRIVAVAGTTLTIIGIDGSESTVALPTDATAVSVSPDGTRAAVAHDAWISHVDLDTETVLATHPVAAQLGDVVIDDQGFAHGFPQTGQWVSIYSVNLATGATTTRGIVRHRTRARLHPAGDRMYGADNGVSPSDLERYSLENGQVSAIYDSPYHGDYPFCGDLWFGPDGDLILSRCGVVVQTSTTPQNDLRYVMRLDGVGGMRFASSSTYTNEWLVVTGSDTVSLYDIDSGSAVDTLVLPARDPVAGTTWSAGFVFGSDTSSSHYVLAADDLAAPTAWALITYEDPAASATNLPPTAEVARFMTGLTDDPMTLDGSASSDPEGEALAFTWTLVSEPAGSNLVLATTAGETAEFVPTVAGVYEFDLTVNDGERTSSASRVSVNTYNTGADVVHRLEGGITDVEYSKSQNTLVFLGTAEQALHLLDLGDFTERTVELPQAAYTVAVSPDGLFAAVSHDQLVSLIDIQAGTVTDSQANAVQWGDVVLDHNYRAHVIPNRDQWVRLYSMDFAADVTETHTGFSARARTQIRMHPIENWVYGADRGLSPSDFEKYDVASIPAVMIGDSPYHGTYSIAGNIWISESGDRLLVRGGSTFFSSSDPMTDMTYAGSLPDNASAVWADHSATTDEWAVLTYCQSGCAPGTLQLALYTGEFLNEVERRDLAPVETATQSYATSATQVFQNADGTAMIIVLDADGLRDGRAIAITPR